MVSWKKFNIRCTGEFGGGRAELGEEVKVKWSEEKACLEDQIDGSYLRKVATSLSTHNFFHFFLLMSFFCLFKKKIDWSNI